MASAKKHITDNLKCPICQDLLAKPKILPCSHTFCEGCLSQLHSTQALSDKIKCAVCRQVAALPNKKVSNFPTNQIVQSLAEDFKERSDKKATDEASSGQRCTVCDVDDQGFATFFCQNCSEFFCDSCLKHHKMVKMNVSHELVPAKDIVTGKIKKQFACPEHPRELHLFVCITCLMRICCRCLEVSHSTDEHEIIGIADFEESHKAEVYSLQVKIEQKTQVIQNHVSYVNKHIYQVKSVVSQRMKEIKNAHKVAAKRLRQSECELLEYCSTFGRSLCQDLEGIVKDQEEILEKISAKISVVKEEATAQYEDQSLSERAARVHELETIIEGDNLDRSRPESIASRAQLLTFKLSVESNGLNIGIVSVKKWELRKTVSYDGGIACSTATHLRQLAIATREGEIKLFSVEGQLLHTPSIVGVRGLAFLSNGRCVVRQANNKLTVYSARWEERAARFETMNKKDGGDGALSVDDQDRIYVNYRTRRQIRVFAAAGGTAMKDIQCNEYEPLHISAMGSGTRILIQSHSNTVRIIDDAGEKKHVITKDVGTHIHPSVCRDGTILLACMNHSKAVFSIEQYTCELEYIETLVADQNIEKPNGKWCYLQEVTAGNIVLCTPDKLYFYIKLF